MEHPAPQSPSAELALPAGVSVEREEKRPKSRSPWLQIGLNQGFEWNQVPITIPGLPPALAGLRIVHLSDTHLKPRWSGAYDALHQRLANDPPDLLLFTGDLLDAKLDSRPTLPIAQRFVSRLAARLGIFGISGNHDGDFPGPRFPAWNMQFIHRRFIRLENHEAAIDLIGLPSVRRTGFDPRWIESLPQRKPGVPRIVLGHYPDQIRFIAPLQADLMLSGHTHGGQMCLPGGRALMTHDYLPKHMARGAHRFGDTTLIVNRGFGMTKWPIRFCCPAEVVEIRLEGKSQ